jgi:hypothetical protein
MTPRSAREKMRASTVRPFSCCPYSRTSQKERSRKSICSILHGAGPPTPMRVPVAATGVDRGRLQSGVAEAQNNRSRCAARRLYQPMMRATAINAPVMSTKELPITRSEIRSPRLASSVSSDAQSLREMSVITAATKM